MRILALIPWLLAAPGMVHAAANLSLTQAENAPPVPGSPMTYRIVVVNLGPTTISDLTVTDTVSSAISGVTAYEPAGFPPATVTPISSPPGSLVAWTFNGISMASGDTYTFTITGQLGAACVAFTVTVSAYAWGTDGVGPWESTATDTFSFNAANAISAPSGLTTWAGDGWAVIGWTAGNEGIEFVDRYDIWRSQNSGTASVFVGTTWATAALPPNTSTYTSTDTRMFWDRGLVNGQAYTYIVQGLSGCATAYSTPINVTPTAYIGSMAGLGLVPVVPFGTVFTAPGDTYIQLAWTHPPAAETLVTSYYVYRSTAADGPLAGPFVVSNLGSYLDQSLTNLVSYYYMVTPCCPDRLPSFTFATPFRPARGQGIPGAHTDASGPRVIKVYWDAAADGDYAPLQGYRVYRSDDGGRTLMLVSGPVPITGLSYLDTVPGYGKQYVYIIRPVDARGNEGVAFEAVLIFVAIPTNRLFLNHNQFRPARNEVLNVVFQVTEPGRVRVSVFTPTGERVRTLFDQVESGAFSPDAPFNARDRGLPALIWDGTNERGELVGSGAYLLVLEINKARDFRSVVVLR